MKVLLLKDVSGIGQRGAVIDVKDGHGRNFLIPQGFAQVADARAIHEAEAHKLNNEKKQARKNETQATLIERLKSEVLEFRRKANDKGHLFDAVDAKDVTFVLEKHGFSGIKKDHLEGLPLKALGEHTITVGIGGQEVPVRIMIQLYE